MDKGKDKNQQTNAWRNRIVGHGEKPAVEFLANPKNWRLHPKHQQETLKGAIEEIGLIDDVTENVNTGAVVNGHLRVTLALREGEQTLLPYKLVDLTPEEEAFALATLDPITMMAYADKEQLSNLLEEVKSDNTAVQQMLSNMAEREGLVPPDFQPVGIDEQGRLDEKAKTTCPECGFQFVPK